MSSSGLLALTFHVHSRMSSGRLSVNSSERSARRDCRRSSRPSVDWRRRSGVEEREVREGVGWERGLEVEVVVREEEE